MARRGDRIYKVMYRLRVRGVETGWQLLVLDDRLYCASVEAPDAQTALHWRGVEVARAIKGAESGGGQVIDLRVTEVTAWEALGMHLELCQHCRLGGPGGFRPDGERCHPGRKLQEAVEVEGFGPASHVPPETGTDYP